MMDRLSKLVLCLASSLLIICGPIRAEEFYCEVLDVDGSVLLSNDTESSKAVQEGDLLKVDDVLEVGEGSYVDIAYDRDWNNVTRVEENSKVRIRSLFPTTVDLDSGGLFAKLKKLPKESTFDVQTPTAIASVRGTEYRTTFTGGQTEVFNVSESDVYVYGVDEAGKKQEAEPVVLRNSQKTQIVKRGVRPMAPHRMAEADFKPVQHARERIENKIKDNAAKGRVGRIQNLEQVESVRRDGSALVSRERQPLTPMSADDARKAASRLTGDEEAPAARTHEMREKDGREGQRFGQREDDRMSERPNPGMMRQREMQKRAPGPRVERLSDGFGQEGFDQPYGPDSGRRPEESEYGNPPKGPGQRKMGASPQGAPRQSPGGQRPKAAGRPPARPANKQ